jgi:hypothetical protein
MNRKGTGSAEIEPELTTEGINEVIQKILRSHPIINLIAPFLAQESPVIFDRRPETHSFHSDIRPAALTSFHNILLSIFCSSLI